MAERTCSIDGCERKHNAHGLCSTHCYRRRLGLDLHAPIRALRPGAICSIADCDREHAARGLCHVHHRRLRDGRDLHAPIRRIGRSSVRDELGRKRCTSCFKWKMVTGYAADRRRLDELRSTCRSCDGAKTRERVYGVDEARINELLAMQGGGCAGCGARKPVGKYEAWHIDHDHSCCAGNGLRTCGRCVRGVLCHHCNRILGCAQDDPQTLRSLAAYLEATHAIL